MRSALLAAMAFAALSFGPSASYAQDKWSNDFDSHNGDSYAPRYAASAFDSLSIFIEYNVTSDDAEIGIEAEPETESGLKSFTVLAPNLRKVVNLRASSRFRGIQNIADLEGPALPGLAILDVFPEGKYYFFATATDGERFFGTAELSHELTDPTSFLSPTDGAVVSPSGFTIEWTPVEGAERYLLEIENETDDLGNLIELPGDVTSFEVPASLLAPGAEFQSAVNAIGDNGNIVQVEVAYSIGN